MKRPLIALAFVILASAALGTGLGRLFRPTPAPASDPPRGDVPLAAPPLRLRTLEWEVGAVSSKASVTRRFEIANPGPTPWTRRNLTSSCPCATASLSANTVEPGKAVWLEVTYHAPERGKAFAHVMLEFAEPGPVIQLTVQGEARPVDEGKKGKP